MIKSKNKLCKYKGTVHPPKGLGFYAHNDVKREIWLYMDC